MRATTITAGELRTLPLTDIQTVDGFNPRTDVERAELDRLADSIALHGILVPLIVRPDGDGFVLIAGARRLAAAEKAGFTEVPAVVRDTDDDTDGLELAIIENVARQELNPVEEALAYRRLLDRGLTRKGVAETLSIAQKRVTERLQLLELPEEVHSRLADGSIPPSAVKPLVRLAKIQPGLCAVAVRRIEDGPANDWQEPKTWQELVESPIAVVCADHPDQIEEHPEGVYEAGYSYPVERFELSEKAAKDLAAFSKLNGTAEDDFRVQFGAEEVADAAKLGAAHADGEPSVYGATLIVGQDVADQLAGDFIARLLKERRAQRRREREWQRRNGADGGQPGAPHGSAGEEPSEEELAEQRKREREEAAERRRAAVAHNLELGAACVSKLAKVKIDERVVKIVAAADLEGDLARIASRGARYGFPGWPEEVALKTPGKTKIEYLGATEAEQRAREFLVGAKTAAEIAGRSLALLAMARYADEECVAQSSRSWFELSFASGRLPWSGEVLDLIDQVAAERLPEHLIEPVVSARREQREREQERERIKAEREKAMAELIERLPSLSAEERDAAVAEFVAAEESLDDRLAYDYSRRRRVDQALAELAADDANSGEQADDAAEETTAS